MPAASDGYERLDPNAVQATVDRLVMRITRRFPDRHLGLVASQLSSLVREVTAQGSADRRRNRVVGWACRVAALLVVGVAVSAIVLAIKDALPDSSGIRGFQWLSVLESGIADLVYASIAVYFLTVLPNRLTRRRLLALLHRLRSLAHVVDMHQLTKDPERLQQARRVLPGV